MSVLSVSVDSDDAASKHGVIILLVQSDGSSDQRVLTVKVLLETILSEGDVAIGIGSDIVDLANTLPWVHVAVATPVGLIVWVSMLIDPGVELVAELGATVGDVAELLDAKLVLSVGRKVRDGTLECSTLTNKLEHLDKTSLFSNLVELASGESVSDHGLISLELLGLLGRSGLLPSLLLLLGTIGVGVLVLRVSTLVRGRSLVWVVIATAITVLGRSGGSQSKRCNCSFHFDY